MMCAGCLKPLKRIHGTAYVQCCSKAYWLTAEPLPRDAWWGARRHRGHTLYTPSPRVRDYNGKGVPV